MTHTPTPWFKNNRFWCGPRFDTDDQSDGMVDDILEVYGENKEIDIDFVLRAVNAHEALLELAAEAMWRRDYPFGGSIYKNYESINYADKEIHRREALEEATRSAFTSAEGKSHD